MLGKDLSEALGGIADDKIEAAANLAPAHRRRPIWVRAAACAAVLALLIGATFFWPGESKTEDGQIIAVPGVLRVYACDMENATEDELEHYELTDAIDSYKVMQGPSYSQIYGGPIPLLFRFSKEHFPGVDISFYVSVEYGSFYTKKENGEMNKEGAELWIQNGDKIYWTAGSFSQAAEMHGSEWKFYADVTIYADERIVGYGIIDFAFYNPDLENSLPSFVVEGFATQYFPLIGNEYQNVTEEYVKRQIEEYKK